VKRVVDESRQATVRQSIRAALLDGPATSRDLSALVGIPEHDVAEELEHLQRTLHRGGERLVVMPSVCKDCRFAFSQRDRHRFTRPGRCPRCRGRRITLPKFLIER
jgi:predicted Zn-ribbon and HTH transcriptional regulator